MICGIGNALRVREKGRADDKGCKEEILVISKAYTGRRASSLYPSENSVLFVAILFPTGPRRH